MVFVGGADVTIPLPATDVRRSFQSAGAQGAIFITFPTISGTIDVNVMNVSYYESYF